MPERHFSSSSSYDLISSRAWLPLDLVPDISLVAGVTESLIVLLVFDQEIGLGRRVRLMTRQAIDRRNHFGAIPKIVQV